MSKWSDLEKRVDALEKVISTLCSTDSDKASACREAILRVLSGGRMITGELTGKLRKGGYGKVLIAAERAQLQRDSLIMSSSENYIWYWELVDPDRSIVS